jgi:hypothetical protein
MIYKFKSAATGDVIMLGPHGDQLMRLLGRDPAPKGIIEPGQMAAAILALQAAIAGNEGQAADADDENKDPVILRQRLWPMADMLRRAQEAGEPVVWGV